ncbi:MAG: molecular chaperone DnaJ [Patescibacteria group bacterium]
MANKDYYQILGVSKKATKDEIKKNFRKLAHKYHPDKTGGDEQKFKEISEAYHVLSDDKRRSEYDMYGNVFSGAGGAGQGGFDFSQFSGGQGFEFDLGDIFNEFFSGGGGRGQRVRRGRDVSVDIQISFSESVFGTERKLLINKVSQCDTCKGSGAAAGSGTKDCHKCNGQGQVRETRQSFIGSFSTVTECGYCNGKGKIPEKPCPTCSGQGVLKKNQEIKVRIPAGINNGEMIKMSGQGEATPGGVAGDLYIKIHVEPDPNFKRRGYDLEMDLNIKLTDALLGSEQVIKTLDGEEKIKVPAGVSFGEIITIKGKGVPKTATERGDLLVKIIINLPKKLSGKTKKVIEELKQEGL